MPEQDNSRRPPAQSEMDVTTFSNSIRLTGRQWCFVSLFASLLWFLPTLWKQEEELVLDPDYRLPHDLANDYWLYERFAGLAADRYDTLILGDSVVWGEYVTRHETLSHYLNALAGRERFANLGLDGAHPLALRGLIEHYAGGISGKNVVLQCNPLWLSSASADLQDETVTDFNHPRLVQQYVPKIPCYKEEHSTRIGVVVEQHVPLSQWTNHLQQAYYNQRDLPSWTLDHPYDNPLGPLAQGLPTPDNSARHESRSWDKSGITEQDYPWVDLETSLQWQAFQRVVHILQQRGNRVFVLVGPFNEHLLTTESLKRYRKVQATIKSWLDMQDLAYVMPASLASAHYGDASHPLAAGYAGLARQLMDRPFFLNSAL